MARRLSAQAERAAWTNHIDGSWAANSAPDANKFGARKTEYNGRQYDSGQEADRAGELQWLEKLGEISDLQYQVEFEVIPKQKSERRAVYRADFVYIDTKTGERIVEDAKGVRTADYILKRKLMLLVHGIRIKEVRKCKRPKRMKKRPKLSR